MLTLLVSHACSPAQLDNFVFSLLTLSPLYFGSVFSEVDVLARFCLSPLHVLSALAAALWALGLITLPAHGAAPLGALWALSYFGIAWV